MTDDMQKFIDETENAEDLGALPWWTPTKKTPAIVGRVLEYRAIDILRGRSCASRQRAPNRDRADELGIALRARLDPDGGIKSRAG